MTHPSKAPIFYRPTATLPHYATAQMTIINPVPVIRPCPPLQWTPTPASGTPTPGVAITYPTATPIAPKLPGLTCRPSHNNQPTRQGSQTWQTFNSLTACTAGRTQTNLAAVNAVMTVQNDLYASERAGIKSPGATATTNAKSSKMRRTAARKLAAGKAITDALHETIHRQRELIGKLISVIVKDRLTSQDKSVELNLKDGEVSEVEKILKLSDSMKSNNLALKSDKTATISFSSGDRKRRTRTATGEKKHLCKRLRKDRKSPKQYIHPCQSSGTQKSSSVVATVTQSEGLECAKVQDTEEGVNCETDALVSATTAKILDLMRPDGDSRLFSLRVEFSRQLKSLEEDFQREYEDISLREIRNKLCNAVERKKDTNSDNQSAKNDQVSDDSDWLPSSLASSPSAHQKSTSLSSDSSGESYSMVKKKFPKRKHVRCYKPLRQNKSRPTRGRYSCFKPNGPRQASGKALQKIDRMLRNPESDNASCNETEREKSFHQKALHKIRQSMALWNKMSAEINSYMLSDRSSLPNVKDEPEDPGKAESDNENCSLSKDEESKSDDIVCIAQEFENESNKSENLAVPPNNKTDPSFMLSKFFQFLPEHHEPVNDVADVGSIPNKEVENESASQHNDCSKKEDHQSPFAESEKSVSDIFKNPAGSCPDEVDKESTNRSAPFLCQFDYPEANDPDIIGEVIVVTTDEKASPVEKCQIISDDNAPEAVEEEEVLIPDTTQELFRQDSQNEMKLENQNLFEDLPPPRECSSPSSVLRLDHYDQQLSDGEDLPKFELLSYPDKDVGKPLVQMFRPLNSEKKESDYKGSASPSEIKITNVVSLNPTSEEEITVGAKVMIEAGDLPTVDNSFVKNVSDSKKSSDEASETQSKGPCSPEFVDKTLARPLKKLISNIKLNKPSSSEVNVVEWGLVPRRAMHLAKQRIQEQLCGGEKCEESNGKNSARRTSLRSHTGSGDFLDSKAKKRKPSKKPKPTNGKDVNQGIAATTKLCKENLSVHINPPRDHSSETDYDSFTGNSDPD